MMKAIAAPLVWALLLSCAGGSNVTSKFTANTEPGPIAPIERVCDGKLPPEMAVTDRASGFALAIGPDGCPHIAWAFNGTLHYARWDGTTWIRDTPFEPAGWHTALDVGRDGRPTLLVNHDHQPRVIRLQRNSKGGWMQEDVIYRWPSGMRFFRVAPGRKVVLMRTGADQRRGNEVHVLTSSDGEWTDTRVDFNLSFRQPLSIAVDPRGRGVIPIVKSKAYTPNAQETNLWIAMSTDASMRVWDAKRLDTPGFNRFQNASIVNARGALHIIAVAELGDRSDRSALLHLQRDEHSQWRAEQFASCPKRICDPIHAAGDSRGRIHVLFQSGGLKYALYDEGRWSFRDLGPYQSDFALLEVDPVTDFVHAVATTPRIHGNDPTYIPLSATPPATP